MIGWAKEGWESMQPFVEKAVYVNAIEDIEEEGLYRLQEAYGSNFDRLVTLKTKYDPSNFFRLNQNIAPSASEAA